MRSRRGTWPFSLAGLLTLALLLSCVKSPSQNSKAAVPFTEKNNVSAGDSFSVPVNIAPEDLIFIQARINNSELLWFVLDTGANGLLINSRVAKSLGLKPDGRTNVGGAGENLIEAHTVKGVSFEFAGARIPEQTATVVALDELEEDVGREVAGIIGFPLFNRHVVEIDFASRKVNAYDPSRFQYKGQGEIIPLLIERNHPHVIARIVLPGRKPLEAKFLVDTGAPSVAGMLTVPFVESNQLLRADYKTLRIPGNRGIGGEIKILLGRASSLELGRYGFPSPVIGFFQDKDGFGASVEVDGLIGNEILRRFKVIFDYPHERMILEPNEHLAEPFESNMSGFRLRAAGKNFKTLKAHGVLENSPAFEAGLRDEDEITAIDGQSILNFTLPQLYQLFKLEGREYLLSVRRGDTSRQLKLKLRRLV